MLIINDAFPWGEIFRIKSSGASSDPTFVPAFLLMHIFHSILGRILATAKYVPTTSKQSESQNNCQEAPLKQAEQQSFL